MDFAMAGYFSVQLLPRRVRICTLPASSRACIRYPSPLISCSHSEPSRAFSTSAASCGLIQAGGEAGLTLRRVESVSVGFVRADFIIVAIYQEFAFLWAHHVASAFSFLGLGLPQTEAALTLSPIGSQTVSLTVSRKSSTELCWAVASRQRPQPGSCSAKRSARLQSRTPGRRGNNIRSDRLSRPAPTAP